MDDTSHDLSLSECDIWVQANLNNKGHVYGFAVMWLVMKQQSWLSVSTRSSSINYCDAREMAQGSTRVFVRLPNKLKKSRSGRRLRRKWWRCSPYSSIANRLKNKFALKNKLTTEKADWKCGRKEKSKLDKIWNFVMAQQVGSSTAPTGSNLSQDLDDDDDEQEDNTTNLNDGSRP